MDNRERFEIAHMAIGYMAATECTAHHAVTVAFSVLDLVRVFDETGKGKTNRPTRESERELQEANEATEAREQAAARQWWHEGEAD